MSTENAAPDLHVLAAAYALDALDPVETMEFEKHLVSCESCPATVSGFAETAATLASGFDFPPPVELRDRVMNAVLTTRQDRPLVVDLTAERNRRRPRAVVATAVAASLALLIGISALFAATRGSDPDSNLQLASVLTAPDAQIAPLAGADQGSISIAWSESAGQFVLLATDLPELPDDRTYELWFIGDSAPQNAGLFGDNDGAQLQFVGALLGSPATWAVTIEPEGGSDAPTSDILYAAEVTTNS